MIFSFISCGEMDDKDYIIGVFKIAKNGNIDDLKDCFYFEDDTKEEFDKDAEFLVILMKDDIIPQKDEIKNFINDDVFPGYCFTLQPSQTEVLISLRKINGTIKIYMLDFIRKPVVF